MMYRTCQVCGNSTYNGTYLCRYCSPPSERLGGHGNRTRQAAVQPSNPLRNSSAGYSPSIYNDDRRFTGNRTIPLAIQPSELAQTGSYSRFGYVDSYSPTGKPAPRQSRTTDEQQRRSDTQPVPKRFLGEVIARCDTSQYSHGEKGRSACTAICTIAATAALLASDIPDASPITAENLARWVKRGVELFADLSVSGRNAEHTSVEDIWGDPVFASHVEPERFEIHVTPAVVVGIGAFCRALATAREWCSEKQHGKRHAGAVIITKSPETVLVVFLEKKWYLIDSHPRPERGLAGAYAISFDSEASCADALALLFPKVEGLEDCGFMGEALNCFEASALRLSQLRRADSQPVPPRFPGEVIARCDSSQYSFGEKGRSACTVICTIAAAAALRASEISDVSPITVENLARWVRTGVDVFANLSVSGRSAEHTSVEDIWGDPVLNAHVEPDRLEKHFVPPAVVSVSAFERILASAREWFSTETQREKSRAGAVIITKTPETVLVVWLGKKWYLIDSHPRPERGLAGAHAISFDSEASCAGALALLFPKVEGLEDCGFMGESLNFFEASALRLSQLPSALSRNEALLSRHQEAQFEPHNGPVSYPAASTVKDAANGGGGGGYGDLGKYDDLGNRCASQYQRSPRESAARSERSVAPQTDPLLDRRSEGGGGGSPEGGGGGSGSGGGGSGGGRGSGGGGGGGSPESRRTEIQACDLSVYSLERHDAGSAACFVAAAELLGYRASVPLGGDGHGSELDPPVKESDLTSAHVFSWVSRGLELDEAHPGVRAGMWDTKEMAEAAASLQCTFTLCPDSLAGERMFQEMLRDAKQKAGANFSKVSGVGLCSIALHLTDSRRCSVVLGLKRTMRASEQDIWYLMCACDDDRTNVFRYGSDTSSGSVDCARDLSILFASEGASAARFIHPLFIHRKTDLVSSSLKTPAPVTTPAPVLHQPQPSLAAAPDEAIPRSVKQTPESMLFDFELLVSTQQIFMNSGKMMQKLMKTAQSQGHPMERVMSEDVLQLLDELNAWGKSASIEDRFESSSLEACREQTPRAVPGGEPASVTAVPRSSPLLRSERPETAPTPQRSKPSAGADNGSVSSTPPASRLDVAVAAAASGGTHVAASLDANPRPNHAEVREARVKKLESDPSSSSRKEAKLSDGDIDAKQSERPRPSGADSKK